MLTKLIDILLTWQLLLWIILVCVQSGKHLKLVFYDWITCSRNDTNVTFIQEVYGIILVAKGSTIAEVPFVDDIEFLQSLQRANNPLMPNKLLLEIQRNTVVHTWIEIVFVIEIFGVDTLESRFIIKLLHTLILDLFNLFGAECLLLNGWLLN